MAEALNPLTSWALKTTLRVSLDDGKELLRILTPDRFEKSAYIDDKEYVRLWVECNQCGTATNCLPDMSAEKLQKLRTAYYEVDFSGADIEEKYRFVMSLPAEYSDNAGRVSRILRFSDHWFSDTTSKQMLDIGAGTGVFLSRLIRDSTISWKAMAIEPVIPMLRHIYASCIHDSR